MLRLVEKTLHVTTLLLLLYTLIPAPPVID
jgi:hypothetical protein